MKRGWTQFWREGSALLLACIPAHALAQQLNSPRKTETNVSTAAAQRNDELSLAGLRPGRDDMSKAKRLFRKPSATKYDGTNKIWQDPCRHQLLSVIPDPNGTIQEVRIAQTNANSNVNSASTEACASAAESHSRWVTGHGLVSRRRLLPRCRALWATRLPRSFHQRRATVRIVVLRVRLGGTRRAASHGGTLHAGERCQARPSGGDHTGGAKSLMSEPTQNASTDSTGGSTTDSTTAATIGDCRRPAANKHAAMPSFTSWAKRGGSNRKIATSGGLLLKTLQLAAVCAICFAMGCSNETPATKSEPAPAPKPAEPAVPDDVQAGAQSLLGSETNGVAVWGSCEDRKATVSGRQRRPENAENDNLSARS